MEEKTYLDDMLENFSEASDKLKEELNGDKATDYAKIYDMQTKQIIEQFKSNEEARINDGRLEIERYKVDEQIKLEKYKIDQEMKLKAKSDEIRNRIDESAAKNEKMALWCKVGIAGAEMVSGIALGVLYLKANLKYGGMLGRDAKKWFDDLKHIKL